LGGRPNKANRGTFRCKRHEQFRRAYNASCPGWGRPIVPTRTLLNLVQEQQRIGGVFGPDELTVMTRAFGRLLSDLKLTKRDDPMVTTVAKLVIELVRNGERDPERVRKLVLDQHQGKP
jgi:hypothetical protein